MYTKEMLLSTIRKPEMYKGVLTTNETKERLLKHTTVMTMTTVGLGDKNVFFFIDDYTFGTRVLPKCFVPSSTQIPMHVKERECLPDGWVDSIEKFMKIFCSNEKQLSSIEELVEFLNTSDCSCVF